MSSFKDSDVKMDETEESRATTPKVVTISDEPEHISPAQYPADPDDENCPPRQFRSSLSNKKLTGRPPVLPSGIPSLSQISTFKLDAEEPNQAASSSALRSESSSQTDLLQQVYTWLQDEKAKHVSKKFSKHRTSKSPASESAETAIEEDDTKAPSDSPDHAFSLDKLERILSQFSALGKDASANIRAKGARRRMSGLRKPKKTPSMAASSDTEYQDGDAMVPSVDACLDNSKTLAYTGGSGEVEEMPTPGKISKDKECWAIFKKEIVRLTHTLRLKGWRRVPLEKAEEIDVERLCGALTNAVYVVSPPKNLEELEKVEGGPPVSKRKPPKLLLRIYGPQADHLIDRENELGILRRLARKKIGPRLLGTFLNGRFEEFFHARTLTPADLRIPETSKQIAKRMRELHDGIELLPEEREGGPVVWKNWDKWVDRCEQVITWVDHQVVESQKSQSPESEAWRKRGFVCGVPWPTFRKAVENYRTWIEAAEGGNKALKKQLIFAHNDAQYGNLLRLQPSGESPLLTPANEHKQLIVIDFEYASANTPGFEFANHFSEWCYNYHSATAAHACNENAYPTPEEQHRFIRSYVLHRPQFHPDASSTPHALRPQEGTPSNSISNFMLDSRAPPGGYAEEERKREEAIEAEIQALMQQVRLWRLACSAQWVAWGIVQAQVPEDLSIDAPASPAQLEAASTIKPAEETQKQHAHLQSDPLDPEVAALAADSRADRPDNRLEEEASIAADAETKDGVEEEEEEFDYLSYSQDRAFLFWGDMLKMGLVKEDELPEDLKSKVKCIDY